MSAIRFIVCKSNENRKLSAILHRNGCEYPRPRGAHPASPLRGGDAARAGSLKAPPLPSEIEIDRTAGRGVAVGLSEPDNGRPHAICITSSPRRIFVRADVLRLWLHFEAAAFEVFFAEGRSGCVIDRPIVFGYPEILPFVSGVRRARPAVRRRAATRCRSGGSAAGESWLEAADDRGRAGNHRTSGLVFDRFVSNGLFGGRRGLGAGCRSDRSRCGEVRRRMFVRRRVSGTGSAVCAHLR